MKPLGFPEADRLVAIGERTEAHPLRAVSLPNFRDWQDRQRTFDDMAAALIIGGVLSGGGDPERVFGCAVTRNCFWTLGAPLALGRTFTTEEDQPGGVRAVVLAHALWKRRYGGDPDVIGRAVSYNADSCTVVGIAPENFDYYGRANLNNDVFFRWATSPASRTCRSGTAIPSWWSDA